MAALDPAKYDAVPIFVTREGQWLLSRFEDGALATPSSGTEICLVPGGHGRSKQLHLAAGIVDVIFAHHIEAGCPQ